MKWQGREEEEEALEKEEEEGQKETEKDCHRAEGKVCSSSFSSSSLLVSLALLPPCLSLAGPFSLPPPPFPHRVSFLTLSFFRDLLLPFPPLFLSSAPFLSPCLPPSLSQKHVRKVGSELGEAGTGGPRRGRPLPGRTIPYTKGGTTYTSMAKKNFCPPLSASSSSRLPSTQGWREREREASSKPGDVSLWIF